jgi:hypothetical protein
MYWYAIVHLKQCVMCNCVCVATIFFLIVSIVTTIDKERHCMYIYNSDKNMVCVFSFPIAFFPNKSPKGSVNSVRNKQ